MLTLSSPRVAPSIWAKAAGVLLFTMFTAVCTRFTVTLPFTPVPLTLQVLAVVLSGLILGAGGGFLAQALFLQAILLGAPLTAHGLGGPAAFASPTAGYLVAFPIAAALAGLLAERAPAWGRARHALGACVGLVAIYLLGTAWLSVFVGIERAWALGVAPFIAADAMKVVVASGLAALARR
jgi:biotin transport system substrate-specific component